MPVSRVFRPCSNSWHSDKLKRFCVPVLTCQEIYDRSKEMQNPISAKLPRCARDMSQIRMTCRASETGQRTSPRAAASVMNVFSSSGLLGMVKGMFMRDRTAGSTGLL